MDDNTNQTPPAAPKSHEPKPSLHPEPPVSGPLAQLEAWLYDTLVVKAPYQLPKVAKDWLVEFGPWVTLAVGVLVLLAILPSLQAITAVSSLGVYGSIVANYIGPLFYISLAVLAVQLVVMFMSVPMLLKRQRKGWLLVFYADVVSLLYTVLNTFAYGYFGVGSLLFGLVGAAIGFYILFQIRSYYKA